jgi:hypothetical protein
VIEKARGGLDLPGDVAGEGQTRRRGQWLSKATLRGARGGMGGTGRSVWEWGRCELGRGGKGWSGSVGIVAGVSSEQRRCKVDSRQPRGSLVAGFEGK